MEPFGCDDGCGVWLGRICLRRLLAGFLIVEFDSCVADDCEFALGCFCDWFCECLVVLF